jgi:hypothetical protein
LCVCVCEWGLILCGQLGTGKMPLKANSF